MAAKVRQAKAEGITPPLPEGGNNKAAQVVDVDAIPSQPSSSSSTSARSDPLLNLTEGDLPFALNFTTQIEHERFWGPEATPRLIEEPVPLAI